MLEQLVQYLLLGRTERWRCECAIGFIKQADLSRDLQGGECGPIIAFKRALDLAQYDTFEFGYRASSLTFTNGDAPSQLNACWMMVFRLRVYFGRPPGFPD